LLVAADDEKAFAPRSSLAERYDLRALGVAGQKRVAEDSMWRMLHGI